MFMDGEIYIADEDDKEIIGEIVEQLCLLFDKYTQYHLASALTSAVGYLISKSENPRMAHSVTCEGIKLAANEYIKSRQKEDEQID